MRFIDANIFLRFLTIDDPVRGAKCFELMKRLERSEEEAFTSDVILAEVIYVLTRSRYQLGRSEVAPRMQAIIDLRGLKLANKRVVQKALRLYNDQNLDFEDCLAVAQMEAEEITEIYSFARGLDRVAGISRVEP